jgi:hypothetical protein
VWKQVLCLVASISAVQAFLPGQKNRYADDLVRGTSVEECDDVKFGSVVVWVCLHFFNRAKGKTDRMLYRVV